MNKLYFFLLLCLLWPGSMALEARAQDATATAAWQVTRFDITASPSVADRSLNVRAVLKARNVGRGAGQTITLRLNNKAEVKAASINDGTATFRSSPESRGNLLRVQINIPVPVAPEGMVTAALDYRLPVAENNGLTMISQVGTQFLPLSIWYPSANSIFAARGSDSAPYRLTVNGAAGEMVVSSGKAAGNTFEQTLNGQPFFVTGNWDVTEGTGASVSVSAYLPKGANAEERKQAEALISLAASARTFYASLLGPAPESPIRLVAVERGAGFQEGGTALLDSAAFRRTKIDSTTALLIGETVARMWVGGATAIRGEGSGVLREGLSRFLATLFLEKQFGAETADAERMRERIAYTAVARREAPLSLSTPLDETYYTSVTNKGAMIWRLVDRALTRDALMTLLRAQLQAARDGGLTLAALRASLVEQGGDAVKSILNEGLDKPTDIDLLIGLPQQRAGAWVSALRNTGSLDVAVKAAATTERGERITVDAVIPARDFGEAVFKTASRIVRVEIDPDKLYPQLDYANDIVPRKDLSEDALSEATRAFVRQEYARSESASRELISTAPHMQEARILLARSLLAQSKLDEAEKEFRAAQDERLPTPGTLAWANIGLGEIALRRGQAAEAVKRFNEAVRAGAEYASTLTARAQRIKAEQAATVSPAVDEAAQKFIAQLDTAIRSGRKTEIESQVISGELVSFIKGIVGSQPEVWQTRVVRTEQLDADHISADVAINARQFGRDQSGTAVFVLARAGGAWKLADIQFFDVK
ncbi:MAG TPA: tetratricopeptide repeat protein [Pyrinomonadaceae bacterium]|nr:tetratricopeptide repeat protein [Pyrinomonadaceae bacterium]